MSRNIAVLLYVIVLVAIIVGVDFLFLRDRFWWRLVTNIGIVFVFAAFYLLYLRRR
jgi:preprotein translocase subunit SecE